jgi:tRNA A-37 threonylcarbamoyl transferase component Bud32
MSKSGGSISAPKLLGLVVDDAGVVLGILEEFIANKGRLSDVIKNEAEISEERRAKWVKQIRKAVALLHEIDVVWGDEKAENVLVGSESDDCFLVDSGGSYTDGWLDRTLMETRAGDYQAVEMIVKFLDDRVRP